MSVLTEPNPGKVIIAILFNPSLEQSLFFPELTKHFGPIDFISENIPFTYSNYYKPEMGIGLIKRLLAFEKLRKQDEIVQIKLLTNDMEKTFQIDGKRRLNIDPGLLTAERVVLATGKNYTHRIYLLDGIYGDLTLMFRNGSFTALPWTYPDYKEPFLIEWLNAIRRKYLMQLR